MVSWVGHSLNADRNSRIFSSNLRKRTKIIENFIQTYIVDNFTSVFSLFQEVFPQFQFVLRTYRNEIKIKLTHEFR